jgi:nucleoside-diphosphate-sugar epimerase
MSEGPRVLLLGGCGFIGRAVLKYMVEYELASSIRVVDKTLPSMAFLSPQLKEVFAHPSVEFRQHNLASAEHLDRAFQSDQPFTVVINLAAETKYAQPEEAYRLQIEELRRLCAAKAAACGVEKYIEVSTAQVYDGSNSKPSKETSHTKPWTVLGRYHLKAEEHVKATPGLNYVVLRLPIVYGPGDRSGLMPRIICAAVYQHTQTKMEFLWGEDLKMNTVHVQDVAAAIWHAVCAGVLGETYNIVDGGNTTQGVFNRVLESIFAIKTGFHGTVMSTLAQTRLQELVDEANDDHMAPWEQMCRAYNVQMTPLSPYLDKELLYNNPLNVDGTKFTELGFQYSCPVVSKELLLDSVSYWVKMGKFPDVFKQER